MNLYHHCSAFSLFINNNSPVAYITVMFVSLHAGNNLLIYPFYSMLLHNDTCNAYLSTGNNVMVILLILNLSLLIHLCSFYYDRFI